MSEATKPLEQKPDATRQILLGYGYMILWILLSGAVILTNKYILDPEFGGFPFPVALTALHMMFCSIVSWAIVRCGVVTAPEVGMDLFTGAVVPIGALFALTLWLGNAAYLYLNVSFIQMLKAAMPLLVYLAGCLFGTETMRSSTMANMVFVVMGIIIASYGELKFVVVGVLCQVGSIVTEAVRLTLVQLLLQRKGVQLNPITTMYLVSPVCFACLLVPLAFWESRLLFHSHIKIQPWLLLASTLAAFALNVAIFLLIGKTSALTMNVAGVLKDVLLIAASVGLLGSQVTPIQLAGYGVALTGAFYYNYRKVRAAVATSTELAKVPAATDDMEGEEKPLLQKSPAKSPSKSPAKTEGSP